MGLLQPAAPAPAVEARWALVFTLGMVAAQLVFLTVGCDWELCGDEAEFWMWSRRLDWSYYARGPLIALLIRLSTLLAGSASLALTGSLMLAVRLPAVLLGGITAWGMYRLASETCRSARAGLIAVLLLPVIPLFRLGGLLMTCDPLLVCCWTWAAVWSYRGIVRDDTRAWLPSALLVALGVMGKYTMLAFPASVGLYLLTTRTNWRQLRRPGFWLLAAGCAAGLAPIVYWNARNGWHGAGQLSNRLGLDSSRNWGSLQVLVAFLAGEALALGIWGLFGFRALSRALVRAVRPEDEDDRSGRLYLLCLWAVVWIACVAAALLGETEMNWSAPAHVGLVALAAAWLEPRVFGRRDAKRPIGAWLYGGLWGLSLIGLTAFQHTEWFYPAFARLIPASTTARPAPLRIVDQTCRMRGAHELAEVLEARLATLRAQGLDPFVFTPTYSLAASLTFEMKGHPDVYCLSWSPGLVADALNQHDLWHPNPRHDVEVFRGRPAVIVEDASWGSGYARGAEWHRVVRGTAATERLFVHRGKVVVAAWDIAMYPEFTGLQHVAENRVLLQTYGTAAYYTACGGTREGFVNGLYRDLLGRAPTPEERAQGLTMLKTQPRALYITLVARQKEH